MAEEKQIKHEKKEEKKTSDVVNTKNVKPMTDNKDKAVRKDVKVEDNKQIISDNKDIKNEVKSDVPTTSDNKEVKVETKAEEKKEVKKIISKKEEAVANINDVRASQKHCMYICSFIKGKKIDDAIALLGEVIKLKRAIKFKGEIPHRKGNMMSGRYPVEASKIMISILKGLKGNVIVNQMDLDKTRITTAFATQAHRPARAGGIKAKRCHIYLIANEIQNIKKPEVKRK